MSCKDVFRQSTFFDRKEHQYSTDLILNPPLHTTLEINAIINKIVGLNSMDYVVDFGAGSGRITIPLLKNNFYVYAIDVSKRSLENLRKTAKKLLLHSLETATSLPRNRKFKALVGADILHHIELNKYLPKIFNSLEKGGKVIFSEPCAFNLAWYIYLPIASNWKLERGLINCTYSNLKNTFEKHGFKNVTISGLGLLPRPFFNWSKKLCKLNDWLGNLPILKLFSYRYIIEATK